MASTSHYKSSIKDIFFNLFDVLQVQNHILGKGDCAGIDEETAKATLKAIEKLSIDKLAPSFAEGDQVPLKLDNAGNVTLPEGIRKSIEEFYKGSWQFLGFPERLGGMGAPRSLYWAGFEMLAGANAAVALYLFGPSAARVIDQVGTQAQKDRFGNKILEEQWGATMVLTEADAGSDVGAGIAKAKHIEDDLYEIKGVKRFVTNGDFDCAKNIMHMVLARPEGAEEGTKGLSMFLVPKFWINEDGSDGERNGVYCTNVEKKMGIKASATCEMTFGEKSPAKGLLLGNVHHGIRQMFMVIEQARMAVGVKSMSTLSTAYLNALEFCKERVQGPDITQALDKSAPKVAIIKHPDVRRMLMMQKSHVEGMRALCMYCTNVQDLAKLEESTGGTKAKEYEKLSNLLLPLIKGYNSEKVYELLNTSLQCFGGSGYLKDYPLEQYIRDQKIDSLYEGTTHIQSLDLIFRKIAKDNGQTLQSLMSQMKNTCKRKDAEESLSLEYDALSTAISDIEAILDTMMMKMGESLYYAGLHGNRILNSLSELVVCWLLVRHAEVADSLREKVAESERPFYDGKIASARFYCRNVLLNITVTKELIAKGTLDLMEIADEVF